jgi:cyclopropane fatty-acyl-phospholipid synthase-like methyltransferase
MYDRLIFLWIPYVVFLVNELLYISFGMDIFRAKDRTAIFYDLGSLPTSYTTFASDYVDPNYSEGYYPGENYKITPREAENNKFEKILELLGAKSGDRILNLGCGMCSFEVYCKEKGIEMVGLTVSSGQANFCKNELGVKAEVWDYTQFHPAFEKQFDHVVWMGSAEHIYAGPHHFMKSYEKKKEKLKAILQHIEKYFKDGSKKRVFFSSLHIHPDFITTKEAFVLERTYGGQFTLNKPGYDIMSIAKEAGYKILYTRDATKDYYMATVLDDHHFGVPSPYISRTGIGLFILGFIYPFAWYIHYYVTQGIWMWMFDGNHHYSWNHNYSLKEMNERPITLWWCAFELSK